jgi:catechol 2,3-dioxygenase-like lactoylglutathione lyase family enzyme
MPASVVHKLTPVLIVDAIEPCLPFWVDRLGFEKVAEVPHGDGLGFVMLVRDGVEVMYQTRASVADDAPGLAPPRGATADLTALFLEVADLDAVVAALDGMEHVVPRRRTFYGMDEVGVREPGGRVVMFAQPVAAADTPSDAPAVEPTGT